MISIEKANLIAALKKVMPGVEKGATVIDGADQLLFTGASVSSITAKSPCPPPATRRTFRSRSRVPTFTTLFPVCRTL